MTTFDAKSLKRRDFLRQAGLVIVVPAALGTLVGCGDDEGDTADGPSFVAISQGSNHTHLVNVTCAALAAGVTASFSSTVDDGHLHVVSLTSDDFATLASGGTVNVTTFDLHVHTWSISAGSSCA